MAVTLKKEACTAALNAIVDLLDVGGAGYLLFTPADCTTEIAKITFAAAAFGAATDAAPSVATLAGVPLSDPHCAGGTVTNGVFFTNAAAELFRCTAGLAGDIVLTNNVIAALEVLTITALTVTMPAS